MFKVSKLNDFKKNTFHIKMVPLEIHSYNNGVKMINKFDVPEFVITGSDDINEYILSFRFNKSLEKLYDIPLNDFVNIDEFVDFSCFKIDDLSDLDVFLSGKIYRIINKNIVINGYFLLDDSIMKDTDYVGKFEIEFNLDDYLNKDGKSDI